MLWLLLEQQVPTCRQWVRTAFSRVLVRLVSVMFRVCRAPQPILSRTGSRLAWTHWCGKLVAKIPFRDDVSSSLAGPADPSPRWRLSPPFHVQAAPAFFSSSRPLGEVQFHRWPLPCFWSCWGFLSWALHARLAQKQINTLHFSHRHCRERQQPVLSSWTRRTPHEQMVLPALRSGWALEHPRMQEGYFLGSEKHT